jgi:hypothetical protein
MFKYSTPPLLQSQAVEAAGFLSTRVRYHPPVTRSRLGPRTDFLARVDGIAISGSDVLVDGLRIWTGDDAVVVSPPARNVTVRNVEAHGTHGLSVTCTGGEGGNYTFEKATISDSLMGCRFKGKIGSTCTLTDVHWRDITVTNVSYPVHFTEHYWDPEKGVPPPANGTAAFARRFTFENISGQVARELGDGSCTGTPCWYSTPGPSVPFPRLLLLPLCHRLKTRAGPPDGSRGIDKLWCLPKLFRRGTLQRFHLLWCQLNHRGQSFGPSRRIDSAYTTAPIG